MYFILFFATDYAAIYGYVNCGLVPHNTASSLPNLVFFMCHKVRTMLDAT